MEGRAEMPHMKNLRVLIIEDDGLIALLLENVLEGMGHQVCATASTETAAVDAAHRYLPDLVIADAHLRSGSGVSAVAEIVRARGEKMPYVFLRGDITGITARLPGAITLRKPFWEASLADAIERALEGAAVSRSLS
jgi:two-component system, response regulator PdtaR